VRPVVLDTSVILPAVISPRGYRRRFWVLLAFGALAERCDLARLQAGTPRVDAHEELQGRDIAELAAQAEARYQRLLDALPPSCPDHWRLVGSRPLLAEYERKLHEVGPKLNPNLRPTDIETIRRQIEAVCVDMTDDFDPEQVPTYTADRKDDPVIHTALLADATWLIADDKRHISTDPTGITEYQLPGTAHRVSALTFSNFLDQLSEVDLDEVDPSLIQSAFGPNR
jgi:predicted nucleic acid-binding protein